MAEQTHAGLSRDVISSADNPSSASGLISRPLYFDVQRPFERVNSDDNSSLGLDRFNSVSLIGQGNTAKVYLAYSKTNQKVYAIKVINKAFIIENKEIEKKNAEKRALVHAQKPQCPFIIPLYATFQTETELCLAMEYASGGDLMTQIQKDQFGTQRAK